MRKGLKNILAGVAVSGALSGCADIVRYSDQSDTAGQEALIGMILGGIGAQSGNPAAAFVGRGMIDYASANAGRSQIVVNNYPQREFQRAPETNYVMNDVFYSFSEYSDENGDGIITPGLEARIKYGFNKKERIFLAASLREGYKLGESVDLEIIRLPDGKMMGGGNAGQITSSVTDCLRELNTGEEPCCGRYEVNWYVNGKKVGSSEFRIEED